MGNFIPVEPEKWAEMVKALALVAEMDKTINASQAECRRLKAENERLREAGNEMWKVIFLAECIAGVEHTEKSALAWDAAKEGKDK